MKIAKLEAFCVALPYRRLHQMAHQRAVDDLGRYTIVVLTTDDELTGLGEATVLREWGGDNGRYYGESPELTVPLIQHILGPAIVGRDPFDIEVLNRQMDLAIKGYPYAKAAVDMCLHDVKGKSLGVPVYQLLGGLARKRVPIAHSLGIMDFDRATTEAAEAVAEGVKTIKLKVGRELDYDIEIVKRIREVIGPDRDIVVDANQGWATPKIAIRQIRQMEDHGVRYVEQPVEGLRRMAQVARAVDTAIMADESAWTAEDVLEIVERGAADMISMYTTKPGGLLKAKKLAAVAEAAGLPLNVNGSHETGVGNAANLHLVASTSAVTEAGVFPVTTVKGQEPTQMAGRMYEDDIVTESFRYEDGALLVPSTPGLGIELDPEKIERYRVR